MYFSMVFSGSPSCKPVSSGDIPYVAHLIDQCILLAVFLQLIYCCWTLSVDEQVNVLMIHRIKSLLHWIYRSRPDLRSSWRLTLGTFLKANPLVFPASVNASSHLTVLQKLLSIISAPVAVPVPPIEEEDEIEAMKSNSEKTISSDTPSHQRKPAPAAEDAHSKSRLGLDANGFYSHIRHLLELLLPVVEGMKPPTCPLSFEIRAALLQTILLPLHQPNEMVLWRDQVPVLQDFHPSLVRCVMKTADGSADLLGNAILGILKQWPDSFNNNTPKQVLFLHELESLIVQFRAAAPTSQLGIAKVWTPFWVSALKTVLFNRVEVGTSSSFLHLLLRLLRSDLQDVWAWRATISVRLSGRFNSSRVSCSFGYSKWLKPKEKGEEKDRGKGKEMETRRTWFSSKRV